MAEVSKGIVMSIKDKVARVAPITNTNLILSNIKIADYIDDTTINKGTRVAYVCFEDATGLILSKMD